MAEEDLDLAFAVSIHEQTGAVFRGFCHWLSKRLTCSFVMGVVSMRVAFILGNASAERRRTIFGCQVREIVVLAESVTYNLRSGLSCLQQIVQAASENAKYHSILLAII